MKIEDTTFQFSDTAATSSAGSKTTHTAFGQGLDASDLGFLDWLNVSSQTVKVSSSAEAKQISNLIETTLPTKTTSSIFELKAEVNAPAEPSEASKTLQHKDNNDIKEVKQALELLKTDLDAKDLRLFQQHIVPQLSVHQPVSIQTLFSTNGSGSLSFKGVPFSKAFSEMVQSAYKTGRPVRIDLENQTSVILKIRNGKVSAEFLSADPKTSLYLKQHVAELRHRMEAEELPVDQLSYREERQQQERQPEKED
ncbi:MAG: hypothetical protein KTR14_07660 [Vampirovibrio sp.]|nr:hypothetical protein [Vampirovibrio sp.]